MTRSRLIDRVGVVTGGASGIGEATVRMLVAGGGAAVIADVQDERGQALASELGEQVAFCHCDVAQEGDVARTVELARSRFGHLDLMCNNAGMPGPDPSILDVTVDQYRWVFDVLVLGVVLGTKHAARVMIAGGGGGAIVNITSVAGLRGGEGPHLYTTAKHGVIGLTRSAASELGRRGIRVNAIAPAGIPTPMAAAFRFGDAERVEDVAASIASRSPIAGRGSTADDIAEAVAYLATDASGYVTGEVLVVDAGKTFAPPRVPAG